MFSQLRLGAVQFVLGSPLALQSLVPPAGITVTGFAFKDEDEGLRALDGPLGDYIRKEFEARGFHAPGRVWNSGFSAITWRRIRSATPTICGASRSGFRRARSPSTCSRRSGRVRSRCRAQTKSTPRCRRSWSTGKRPINTIEARRDFEVQKYMSLTRHSWSCLWPLQTARTGRACPPIFKGLSNATMPSTR